MQARHGRGRRGSRRAVLAVVAALVVAADITALTAAASTGTTPAARTARPPTVAGAAQLVGPQPPAEATPKPIHYAWIRPAVVNVWEKPTSPTAADRITMRAEPAMRAWTHGLSVSRRLGLNGRLMTQALHGDRVAVVSTQRGWSLVRLEAQTGGAFRHGIIGFVPDVQLSSTPIAVRTQLGRPTPAAAIGVARRYLGVSYLWGGMSAYGIDCSGLTYLAFRAAGVTLPRDAADQAAVGHAVGPRHLQPGDLVFFGRGARTSIHHVGIYVGHEMVLHAPHTGSTVRYTPLSAFVDYWGARRVLP